jgi:hypothetical protein
VAEPWTDDLAALGEHTRRDLRLPAHTRAALTAHKEPKMRLFKSHPALAAVLALVLVSVLGGAAYAVVREVWLDVDPHGSASEIQDDLQHQLQAADIPAHVQVDKSSTADGGTNLKVTIRADQLPPPVYVKSRGPDDGHRTLYVTWNGTDDGPIAALVHEANSSADVKAALDRDYDSDDQLAAAMRDVLAHHGLADVTIAVDGRLVRVTVQNP